jgi:hypothetical protein
MKLVGSAIHFVGSLCFRREAKCLLHSLPVRLQVDACREFSLIDSESFASVAESHPDMLGCFNVKTPCFKLLHVHKNSRYVNVM